MPTKLSRYCEGLMEAGWLAAIILVPLFFDIYSSRIFEPDKLTLLRSVALLILTAWLLKLLDEGRIRWQKLEAGPNRWKSLLTTPLLAPVLALAVVYVLSTLFSVTPRASLWGSYQRLQGTYTTFAYLIIFASMAANLRRRAQVERLLTVAVLVSLPISLYGVLQRNKIDPVPWGGDTSTRIASNMGNSIFVAAYLIMAFPLAVGRIIQAAGAILREESRVLIHSLKLTFYVVIVVMQVVALYMSQSRGPALGWLAGLAFLAVLLAWHWRKRWLTVTMVVLGMAALIFLMVFNIPNGPLEALRKMPGVGRFGLILDAESNSALVRKYIWEGAADLVSPHAPLQFPDGRSDAFNFLRPVVGYGPESMYVAYNPFYVPELGRVEKRNASPDRSHNETWDSLVITGGLGFLVYVTLFVAIFYYGLKWLGLVPNARWRNVYLGISIGGAIAGAAALIAWRGVEYFGLGFPLGLAAGVGVYAVVASLTLRFAAPQTAGEAARSLTIIVLLAAITSHFIEINFGIAIAATRTYFWTYTALLMLVGYILPLHQQYGGPEPLPETSDANEKATPKEGRSSRSKKQLHRSERRAQLLQKQPAWMQEALVQGGILAMVMSTMGYLFISNPKRLVDMLKIIEYSLTRLPNRNYMLSMGILVLVLTSWLVLAILLTCHLDTISRPKEWWSAFGVIVGTSGGAALLYWLWHAGTLASVAGFNPQNAQDILAQVDKIGGLLTNYYLFIFLLVFTLAFLLPPDWPTPRLGSSMGLGTVLAPVLLIAWVGLVYFTNLRIIHADIAFKMAEPYTKTSNNNGWPVATYIYKERALKLAPDEDYYYLFLGRSYLEQAKQEQDAAKQASLIQAAEADLKDAQKINPLNTDHTANLARLYSWWATKAQDSATMMERAQKSSDYYEMAVILSPQNSTLWGEWAVLYMDLLKQPDEALERLQHALDLDTQYSWTQNLMGNYYYRLSASQSAEQKVESLKKAAYHFSEAVRVGRYFEASTIQSSLISLGDVYIQLGQNSDAIAAYERLLQLYPTLSQRWRVEQAIAGIYLRQGDKTNALLHAQAAMQAAPDESKPQVQSLIAQIEQLP